MRIAYISDNKMYLYSGGKVTELLSERVAHYNETVRTINHNKEWKYSGTGAKFTGAVHEFNPDNNTNCRINGLAWDGDGLVYSMVLGGMGGLYRKNPDKPEAAEEHILTSMGTDMGSISYKNKKLAVVMDGHIAVSDMNGSYDELTDGDSVESCPSWSETENKILCTTKGIARSETGAASEFSPGGIIALNLSSNTIEELYSDEKSDCIAPQSDGEGNIFCVKQPYKVVQKKTPLWKDILLFPVRIIKAIIGFLNAFSVIFGGEPLRDGKKRGDVKSKQKSDRDLYFEGRLIEAEKNEKENAAKGEKNPGIFPLNRMLVKISENGEETIIKRGVQDYILCSDGSVVVSNGRSIIHIGSNGEEDLAKAKLAHCLCEIPEVKDESKCD